jgi:bifunctional non-homologous end joining protein LigD
MGLEGVMPKRADAPYVSARTETWVNLKYQPRQEFILLCFTDRTNVAREAGSMLLGY